MEYEREILSTPSDRYNGELCHFNRLAYCAYAKRPINFQ